MKQRLPAAIGDGLTAALVALTGAAFAIPRLGFYSDDWVLLAIFHQVPDQSLAGLMAHDYGHHFTTRPVQTVYSALLYYAFGLEPAGYHMVNAVVVAASACLLTLVLGASGVSRAGALGAGVAYASLPAFSTARFWYAAFAVPLCVLLYLTSLRIDLAVARWAGWRLAIGRTVSLAMVTMGLLAYEITLPLAFLNPVVVRLSDYGAGRPRWTRARWATWLGPTLVVLLSVGVYKAAASDRLGPVADPGRLNRIAAALIRVNAQDGDYGLNLPRAFAVNFGDHVVSLPAAAWTLGHRVETWFALVVMALSALVARRVWRAARDEPWRPRQWAALTAAGLGAFVLGYAIFLTNTAIQITATGMANRTSMAAGLGVAMTTVGALGWLLSVAAVGRWRARLFAGALGLLVASGTIVLAALSTYWGEAYPRARAVVAAIRQTWPSFPPRATLFLGGECPYIGPAVVFESSWDLAFALRLASGDPTVSADVVSRSFRANPTQMTTALYDDIYEWPYGPNTMLFDARSGRVWTLTDQGVALGALAEAGLPRTDCPPGKEGIGTRVPGF